MEHGTTTSSTLKDKTIPLNYVPLVFGILSALNDTKLFKIKTDRTVNYLGRNFHLYYDHIQTREYY